MLSLFTRIRLLTCTVITLTMSAFPVWAQGPDSFLIAVAPHTSARVIIESYQPLRLFLEKTLGRPVEVVTATDFTEFAYRAMAKRYDLVVTTGHQARLLQTDAAYIPLVTYKADFKSVAVVPATSKLNDVRDLSGQVVLGLSPSSLVTIWGQNWMRFAGITPAQVRYVSAADSVGQLLLAGEGVAGFMSLANFQKLSPTLQSRLRILAESPAMTGRVYLLNGRHAKLEEKIETALWQFADTPEGRSYMDKNHLGGYRTLAHRELLAMEPHASEVRRQLKQYKP